VTAFIAHHQYRFEEAPEQQAKGCEILRLDRIMQMGQVAELEGMQKNQIAVGRLLAHREASTWIRKT
jgi:alkylated DNA nucleotide flippase Atl1